MSSRRSSYGFGLLSVVVPFIFHAATLLARDHARRLWLEVRILAALCAISVVVELGARAFDRRDGNIATSCFWGAVAVVWGAFWWFDLRHARVQVLAAVVPLLGFACGWLLARGLTTRMADPHTPRRRSLRVAVHSGHFGAAFVVPSLAVLWVVFWERSDNGCTGVSELYEMAVVMTAILVFTMGPSVVASHLTSALSLRGASPDTHSPYREPSRAD